MAPVSAMDLDRFFMGGMQSGEADRMKREKEAALVNFLASIEESMQPRTETVFPDLSGPVGAPPESGAYFNAPGPTTTRTVNPAKADVAASIVSNLGKSKEVGTVADFAAKLFGGYLTPEKGEAKAFDPSHNFYIPGMGIIPGDPSVKERKGAEFEVVTNPNTGAVSVVDKLNMSAKTLPGIGGVKKTFHYGQGRNGEIMQIEEQSGATRTFPGIFGPDVFKLSASQKLEKLDEYYTRLLKKFNANQITDSEIETLNMLTDLKERTGALQALLQGSGALPAGGERPWEVPAPPPAPKPEKGGILDWFKGAPEVLITPPKTSNQPKFRRPGEAPGPGQAPALNPGKGSSLPSGMQKFVQGSYSLSVAGKTYGIRPPQDKSGAQVKEDIAGFEEAYRKGIDLNTLFRRFEEHGYVINPGGE